MKSKKIILIGNYPKDRQESMERFAQLLYVGFEAAGFQTEIWKPSIFFGKPFRSTTSGIGKLAGYIDKWILFPMVLKARTLNRKIKRSQPTFHICDHSNAPYLRYLPKNNSGITCHDVLAIRGAFGFADAYCPASRFGIILQKWILKNLQQAKKLAAVSEFTLQQLNELIGQVNSKQHNWQVIHNGFNASFKPVADAEVENCLIEAGLNPVEPFLLHVGSGLERKNRKLLVEMVAHLGDKWNGSIYFAGKVVDDALLAHARKLNLQDRIVSVVRPSHQLLEALYNACEAFVFPSFSEGFGWPIIEAQACGAPVIASSYQPMPEVSGGAALHADPNRPEEFAAAFLSLRNQQKRTELIQLGFENAKRFHPKRMVREYLRLYGLNPVKTEKHVFQKH